MSMRLLIIEDDPVLREAYEIFFSRNNYDVKVAKDGREALDTVKRWMPEIILLDIILPNLDGFEFLKEFDVRRTGAKVIVMTNLNSPQTTAEAEKLGASKVLYKARLTPQQLAELVAEEVHV